MRRLILAAACLIGTACHRPMPVVEVDESGNQPPASVIGAPEPAFAAQMLHGFYQVEANDWRWTAGKFAVVLGAPAGAAQNGATLDLKLSLPQVVIDRKKAVTLSAWVNGAALEPERYDKAGDYTYSRRVPPPALVLQPVKVDFALDRYLAAGEVEEREFGIIVHSVGLR